VANPLGKPTGRKKRIIVAVYFSLANFPPRMRSSVDQIQLVLLCREIDSELFGQDIASPELIKDMHCLEDTGLPLLEGLAPFVSSAYLI
jgi:hypothetical protein